MTQPLSKLSTTLLISSMAIIGASCATPESNPIYEYSTNYKGPDAAQSQPYSAQPYISEAGYPAPAGTVFSNNPQYAGSTVTYYPAPQPTTTSDQIQYVSQEPVNHQNTHIAGAEMIETGGQNAGYNGELIQSQTQNINSAQYVHIYDSTHAATPSAQAQTYSTEPIYMEPAQSLYASTPSVQPMPTLLPPIHQTTFAASQDADRYAPIAGGGLYIVQEGDTIYRLSRQTCTSVQQIQSMNGVGADFIIKSGQTLRLPNSQC